MTPLDRWHAYIKSQDHAALLDMLHPDVVFESPVVHTPQRGRDITYKYLASADKVLGGPGFKYVGEWTGPNTAILEFENVINGMIVNFKVMVRPLKAIQMVHQMMGEMLAQMTAKAS